MIMTSTNRTLVKKSEEVLRTRPRYVGEVCPSTTPFFAKSIAERDVRAAIQKPQTRKKNHNERKIIQPVGRSLQIGRAHV